jgi:O-antigen/teichoic acid export membrane protein
MPAAPVPTARQTALVAVGQGSVMFFGGILGILIARRFGKSEDTDAFFAAYGVYTVGLTFGGTFRFTAVPTLVSDYDGRRAARMLSAVSLIALALAIPMVLLADSFSALLVEDADGVGAAALRILWIGSAAQLVAALLATMLSVRGGFTALGVATLFAGPVTVLVFVATAGLIGIHAAAVGATAGALWQVGVYASALDQRVFRRLLPRRSSVVEAAREAGRLVYASAPFIGSTVAYVVCIAVAAREETGSASVFAYAFMLAGILLALTSGVAVMIRSPSLVSGPERTREVIGVSLRSFRLTVLLCGPIVGATFLLGHPVIGSVLGPTFSDGALDELLVTFACLVGWLLASAAGMFALVELLARHELRRLAWLAAAENVVLAPLAVGGAILAGVPGIAVTLSLVQICVAAAQLRWAFGPQATELGAAMVRASGREIAVVAAAFGPAALVLTTIGGTPGVAASAVIALGLGTVATALCWPTESRGLLAIVRGG